MTLSVRDRYLVRKFNVNPVSGRNSPSDGVLRYRLMKKRSSRAYHAIEELYAEEGFSRLTWRQKEDMCGFFIRNLCSFGSAMDVWNAQFAVEDMRLSKMSDISIEKLMFIEEV